MKPARQYQPQGSVTVGLLAFWHPQPATTHVESCDEQVGTRAPIEVFFSSFSTSCHDVWLIRVVLRFIKITSIHLIKTPVWIFLCWFCSISMELVQTMCLPVSTSECSERRRLKRRVSHREALSNRVQLRAQTQFLSLKEIERRSATACNCVRPCVAA